MTDDEDGMTEREWAGFLADNPSTLPPFAYTLRDVGDADAREAMVAAMSQLAELMGRLVPLGGLDGITVASDYRQALADLDRGTGATTTTEPTVETFGTGVAMSSVVIRDGLPKTHVTLLAGIAAGLIGDDPELKQLCLHTFMHELGHVAEHTLDHERFGDTMLRPMADGYEHELYRLSHPCWSEPYASRVSAPWGRNAMDGLRELLRGALEQLDERVAAARSGIGATAGRRNDEAAMQILDQVSKVMKFSGYVIGHAHGADAEPLDAGSAEGRLLERLGLRGWFDELAGRLDGIHEAQRSWEDLAVFHPLHRSFETACLAFRLQLMRSAEHRIAWRIWF